MQYVIEHVTIYQYYVA